MSGFVEECRKEWGRLGVPEAVSNEMAADLEADLAEAEAEGASPEEVLGNGVFDARSFAASWATARGVVPPDHRARPGVPRTRARWVVLVSSVCSLFAVLAGLVILGRHDEASVAASATHRSITLPIPSPFVAPPGIRIGPHQLGRVVFVQAGDFQTLGLLLLLVGFVGLCLTLWLWKPWSTLRRRKGVDENVGLPSYL